MTRHVVIAYFILLAVQVGLSGCANVATSKSRLPETTERFTPKKEYAVSLDTLWNHTRRVLEAERIGVTSSDKAEGRIVTDYVQGGSTANISPIWLISQTTRFKFNISMSKASSTATRLNIIGSIEQTVMSKGKSSPWEDVSKTMSKEVASLESWLYEKLEQGLPAAVTANSQNLAPATAEVATTTPPLPKIDAPRIEPPSDRLVAEAMSVAQAQRRLAELGYEPGPIDGVLGKKTIDALSKFQREKGLSASGKLDDATVRQLRQPR